MRPLKLQTSRIGVLALLEDCLRAGGTHIHLKVPGRPQFRVDGRLTPTQHDRLTPDDLQAVVMTLVDLAREERAPAGVTDLRLAFGIESLGSFRAQLVRQRGTWGVVIQCVSTEPPTLGALGLPSLVAGVVEEGRGLLLVGGGRRRASVLASLIRQFNQSNYGHLVSLEEPLEFLHADLRASITQREIGHDVADFGVGLASAVRQDPDALFVADVPEEAEAESILRLAEEGLFVVAGLATSDGSDPARAFAHRFRPDRVEEAESRLRAVLRGVVTVPREGDAVWAAHGRSSAPE